MKLAIIGTAGRGDDGKRLAMDPQHYLDTMKRAALKVARLTSSDELISGGAAWSDHIAVLLFLDPAPPHQLTLELPAELVEHRGALRFEDNGGGVMSNPGGTANHYHDAFQRAMGNVSWSPFSDFFSARLRPGYREQVTPGFKARNLVVARKADHVIAMTFGDGRRLKDGGTAHTMSHFLARPDHGQAWHLDLNTLKLHPNATV